MNDLSLGFIYAIKENKAEDLKASAINFLSAYSGTDPQWYTDQEFDRITRSVFVDYLDSAKRPSYAVIQFFDAKRMWHWDDIQAILSVLQLSQVRNDAGEYVNGFRDMEE